MKIKLSSVYVDDQEKALVGLQRETKKYGAESAGLVHSDRQSEAGFLDAPMPEAVRK